MTTSRYAIQASLPHQPLWTAAVDPESGCYLICYSLEGARIAAKALSVAGYDVTLREWRRKAYREKDRIGRLIWTPGYIAIPWRE